jgi:pimeloyl-ACP methyl ester carboxylesterase
LNWPGRKAGLFFGRAIVQDARMTGFTYSRIELRPGVSIACRRTAARDKSLPGMMFCGGFKSDMTGTKASYLEEQCKKRGQGYVRFDYRGHGFSSGKFEDGCIGDWLEDALEVFDNETGGPQILTGSSMGGWIALLLAMRRVDRVAGLVLIAPAPDFSEDVYRNVFGEEERRHLEKTGLIYLPSDYGAPYPLTKKLFDDGRKHLILGAQIPLTCPVRLIHGKKDTDVSWQKSERIREKLAAVDVKIHYVEDGDHRLSRPEDLKLIDDLVAQLGRLHKPKVA